MESAPVVRVTDIPGPVARTLLRRREDAIPRGVSSATPIFAASGKGATITDVDGNTYIDFAGGIGVLNVGYSHPRVVSAVKAQAERFLHTSFQVLMYEGYVELAERLSSLTPGGFPKKALFLNSGAEAVENAVKLVRAYTGRSGIIAFSNAFHGRTFMALSLTGKQRPYRAGFGPFAPEVHHAPFPYVYRFPGRPSPSECSDRCIAALTEMFSTQVDPEQTAAIIVEPIQGEGGIVIPPQNFLPQLKAVCDRYNLLLVADEIQTGFGRTGRFLAVEHFGVVPDIVLLGKSIAGGLPLTAIVGRADIMDGPAVGGLGGTFGGNPVSCAAALAVLDVFQDEDLVAKGQWIGSMIQERLLSMGKRYHVIGDVRAIGPMAALELVRDFETREPAPNETNAVIKCCYENGLIVLKSGLYDNVIRILVPLVANEQEVGLGLEILDDALSQVSTRVTPDWQVVSRIGGNGEASGTT